MTTRGRLVLALAMVISTTVTGSVWADSGAPGASVPAPASGTPTGPAPADPLSAAVAKLAALADEGTSLVALRSSIQEKLGQARNWLILVKSKEPGSNADEAAKTKWKADLGQVQSLVDNVSAVARKFDDETFPAFVAKVAAAKTEVDAAKAKMAAEQAAATKEAKARIDASIAAIKKVQAANAQAAGALQARFRTQPKAK